MLSPSNPQNSIRDLVMCSADMEFRFSDSITNRSLLKELMAERFSVFRTDKDIDIDGVSVEEDSPIFRQVCEALSFSKDTLLCYTDPKVSSLLSVGYDGVVRFIDKENNRCNLTIELFLSKQNEEFSKDCIYIPEAVRTFLEELIAVEVFEPKTAGVHPSNSRNYQECSDHLKILALFCSCFGYRSAQLKHLIELSGCLEISTDKFKKLLELITPLTVDERKHTLEELSEDYGGDRLVLLSDMLYLLFQGHYGAKKEFSAAEYAAKITRTEKELTFNIYKKIKENYRWNQ